MFIIYIYIQILGEQRMIHRQGSAVQKRINEVLLRSLCIQLGTARWESLTSQASCRCSSSLSVAPRPGLGA